MKKEQEGPQLDKSDINQNIPNNTINKEVIPLTIWQANQILEEKTPWEPNIDKVLEIYKQKQDNARNLQEWVNTEWKERKFLDSLLEEINFPKNKETRFAIFSRVINLSEGPLKNYMNKIQFSEHWQKQILKKTYEITRRFQIQMQDEIITEIEKENLLSPFYIKIFKWVHDVWQVFNTLFEKYEEHVLITTKELERYFFSNPDWIMDFLNENNLLDKDWDNKLAGRTYSLLKWKNNKYEKKAYIEIFEQETLELIKRLDNFIEKLTQEKDTSYNQKQEYINYLMLIKRVFQEKNTDKLIDMWREVEEAWMKIKTPFQITHPLEYYIDKYRQTVSPEWDIRVKEDLNIETNTYENMLNMFSQLYDEIWDNKEIYETIVSNLGKIQLNICSQVLYYWRRLKSLCAAQVVPNDEIVSKKHGKKVFALLERVLEMKRKAPFMKLSKETIWKKTLHEHRKFLFWNNENFYRNYDIYTIGHELWHMLWQDSDTESEMNKTWYYKKIEEFKATTWALVAYFSDWKEELKDKIILEHIMRCVWLLVYKNINQVQPYYCESLIHLETLFKSWVIKVRDGKIEMNLSNENYEKLKKNYIKIYKELATNYLNKTDAWEFLFKYLEKHEDWYFLPKTTKLANFVKHYYELYKEIWNEIDEKTDKTQYTWE